MKTACQSGEEKQEIQSFRIWKMPERGGRIVTLSLWFFGKAIAFLTGTRYYYSKQLTVCLRELHYGLFEYKKRDRYTRDRT